MNKALILMTVLLASSAYAEKWNKSNNPAYFNGVARRPMTFAFHDLPLEAKLRDERLGWSETYWPSNKGGIAYRWNSPNPEPFKYKLHTKEQLMSMSQREISELSPAELYDIAMGDYKYSLTKKVLGIYSERDLWWEGICHGWSLAASNYPEPAPVVVSNRDGIQVPFGSSDVKGLLAMHDAFNSKGFYTRVGERCRVDGKVQGEAFPEDGPKLPPSQKDAMKPECEDVNAGAFHIVLTNMIGINSQGFVADIDRFNDVWNQPVVGYHSEVAGEVALNASDLKNGIASKVRIKTVMTYGDELEFYTPKLEAEGVIGFVSKDPVTGTPHQTFGVRNYDYVLELNQNGEIMGGYWISESRPDMLWMKKRDAQFMDGRFPLAGLNRIYQPR